MRTACYATRGNRVALCAVFGLICSDTKQLMASDIETLVTRAPPAAMPSTDQPAGEHGSGSANSPVTGDRDQNVAVGGNPLWAIPLSSLTAIRERPIFSPTRRPPPLPQPAPTTTAPVQTVPSIGSARPQFLLLGAISGEDEDIAILQDETTKVIVRLRTGESHAGWTFQTTNGREVTLQKNRETAILAIPSPSA